MAIIHQTDMVVVMFEPDNAEDSKRRSKYFGLKKGMVFLSMASSLLSISSSFSFLSPQGRHLNPGVSWFSFFPLTEDSRQEDKGSARFGIPHSSTFERSRSLDITKFVTSQLFSASYSGARGGTTSGGLSASFTRGTASGACTSYAASEGSSSVCGDGHSKAGMHCFVNHRLIVTLLTHLKMYERERGRERDWATFFSCCFCSCFWTFDTIRQWMAIEFPSSIFLATWLMIHSFFLFSRYTLYFCSHRQTWKGCSSCLSVLLLFLFLSKLPLFVLVFQFVRISNQVCQWLPLWMFHPQNSISFTDLYVHQYKLRQEGTFPYRHRGWYCIL